MTTTDTLTRKQAIDQINELRGQMSDHDRNSDVLATLIRDLRDGSPLSLITEGFCWLMLDDDEAADQIKAIVTTICE